MLTRDEQRVVLAAGGFLSVIASRGVKHGELVGGGGPHDLFGHPKAWIDYSGKGIWCHYYTESDPQQLILRVTWTQVRQHVEALPADLIERIRDYQRRNAEHQRSMPTYPNRHTDPERWAEVDAYHHDVQMPEFRRLRADRAALLGEVYPLAVNDEPTDLLELLAAGDLA